MSKRSCLSKTLLFFFVLPNVALASVPWMPEYGEVDSGLHVELITSLHTTGPDVTEEDGMPKGWPAASYPRGAPLLVQGLNGTYLYTSLEGGGILRVPPAPSAHYQTAIPYEAYKRIPAMCSGYYCGDEERNWEDEFDEQGRLVRHKGDTIGALVQRANGDLVGAIYAEEEQTGNYGGYAMTEALKNGALYRTDYDATHGTVIDHKHAADEARERLLRLK